MHTTLRIAVIGGGAAGMMAAGVAASRGAQVTLYEKNPKLGRKLGITGKGRCNLTNLCDVNEFLKNVPVNPKFLYSALSGFTPADCMGFFESLGVPLKTERGNRVFPVSDRAADIVNALRSFLAETRVRVVNVPVRGIRAEKGAVTGVSDWSGFYGYDRVIVCTGGLSYPVTGSTGDGYAFARSLGHTVNQLRPSLVPLELREGFCRELAGLTLKNIRASLYRGGDRVWHEMGELLFTHFGISGPLTLSMSAHIAGDPSGYTVSLDLKPALTPEQLDRRILSDFSGAPNRAYKNSLGGLLPKTMIPVAAALSGIPPDTPVHSVTKGQRGDLAGLLKDFRLHISRFRPIGEAVITGGGVAVSEINPKTMESRIVSGLFFAGEILDVDAYTGGFNLHIAFATARAAAAAASLR